VDANRSLQVGLCARGKSLGYLLVDAQSKFQVRFNILYAHCEELSFGEKTIVPL